MNNTKKKIYIKVNFINKNESLIANHESPIYETRCRSELPYAMLHSIYHRTNIRHKKLCSNDASSKTKSTRQSCL